ncbi:MAG: hypothetical protein IKZ16_03495, partial [Clostridia bacterium]|nr:hypothetical protein [Clostridia bacterium]
MKKALIWLLLAAMLLAMLASCADDPQTESEGSQSESVTQELVSNPDVDDLGEVDLGGRDVVILTRVEVVNENEAYAEE